MSNSDDVNVSNYYCSACNRLFTEDQISKHSLRLHMDLVKIAQKSGGGCIVSSDKFDDNDMAYCPNCVRNGKKTSQPRTVSKADDKTINELKANSTKWWEFWK